MPWAMEPGTSEMKDQSHATANRIVVSLPTIAMRDGWGESNRLTGTFGVATGSLQ